MNLAILKNYNAVGKLHGKGNSFSNGLVFHKAFENVSQLKELLHKVALEPRLSVCVGTFPKNGKVVPQELAKSGDMTRTKGMVNNGSLLVIDNDLGVKLPLSIFEKYWNTFKNAGYIQTKSGSTLAGKKKHGTHTYYVVDKGINRLETAMKFLEDICIVEGLFKIEFYATGKAVLKTPIDLALNQNSRVVYEDDTQPLLHEGNNLSIAGLPTNHLKISKKAEAIKAKELKKVSKEELKLHAKYVKKTTGKKLKKKSDIQHSLINYNKYEVDENFPLHSNNEYLGTVGDLLMGKIDEVLFSDLYEPEYGGGSQKAKYYADSNMFISQAHGGIRYNIVVSDNFNNEMIDEFLKVVPHLSDAHNISKELEKIIETRDLIDRARLIKAYADESGVGIVAIKHEVERLLPLKEEFDKFYSLWLKGDYEKTINPSERLKNYYEYRDISAYVNNGGKNLIIRKYINDEGDSRFAINSLSVEQELNPYREVDIMTRDENTHITEFKNTKVTKLFIDGYKNDVSGVIEPAKQYFGIDFMPKKQLDVSYNLFQGFDVVPKKGDISKWKTQMTGAFGKKHYEYMMNWFADMYQNPDRKVTYALIVKGEKGCVPCDTEFLTPNGWKRIDEYEDGDLVCEWLPDGTTEFKKPKGYTKVEATDFTNMKSMTSDLTLSEGHRVPYITSKNHHAVKSFYEMQKLSSFKIPRYFCTPKNAAGINLSDSDIRLLIMQSADGTIAKNKIVINVKKTRKKLRAVEVLTEAGIEYIRHDADNGFTQFRYTPKTLTKSLSILWTANKGQMKIIYDEMLKWDGSIFNRDDRDVHRFSGNKENNDLFQYVASCVSGKYVNIYKDNREYKNNDIYETAVSTRDTNMLSPKRDTITRVKATDGLQYCFTTSSSFWLMRQNGRIYPTGNTGKNSFEEILGRCLLPSQHYFRTASKDQLFGKFNKQLISNLLIVGQEIVWGGSHDHDSTLKDMITESTRVIELKGQDSFNVNNFSRLYMTSNADWVVPASKDERRFYVVESKAGAFTSQEWKEFYKWVRTSDALSALMYEMMNRDLSEFNNIRCPITKALKEQQRRTLRGINRFVADAVDNGYFGKNSSDFSSIEYSEGKSISYKKLHDSYVSTNPNAFETVRQFAKHLSNMNFTPTYVSNEQSKGVILLQPSKIDYI